MRHSSGEQPDIGSRFSALQDEIKSLRAEIERLKALLKEVRDATAIPLPDPAAHSWRAFYDAACTRLTRCANAARRAALEERDKLTPVRVALEPR